MIIIVDSLRLFLITKYIKKNIKIYFLFKGKFHNLYLIIFKLLNIEVNFLTWNFLEIKNKDGFNKFFELEFYEIYQIFDQFKLNDVYFENYYLKNLLREPLDNSRLKPIWAFYLSDVIYQKFNKDLKNLKVYLPHNNLSKYLKNYYLKKNININFFGKLNLLKKLKYFFLFLKIIIKKYYYFLKKSFKNSKIKNSNPKICFEFAYIQNKLTDIVKLNNFPKNNFMFCERSLKDLVTINNQLSKLNISENFYYLFKNQKNKMGLNFNEINQIEKNNSFKTESFYEKLKFEEFNIEKNLWKSFFKKTNTNVYVTSYYTDYQSAAAKAISELGGCTIFIQLSFYERPGIEIIPNSDVYFFLTNKQNFKDRRILSYNNYMVKTGFINDFKNNYYIEKAKNLRDSLKKNGAKKIIGYFDQGYKSDERWNHGYEISSQNYKFFLEKVIKFEWLGLIIKPKIASEIRLKLKDISKILDQALSTGRCIIIDEGTDSHKKNFDFAPPLISSACDISIHDSLVSATAGMESLSAGNNVIFYDDTGFKNSTICKIDEKIVYRNLDLMWSDILAYFDGKRDLQNICKKLTNFINKDKDNNSLNKILKFCKELNETLSSGNNKKKNEILNNLINKNFGEI